MDRIFEPKLLFAKKPKLTDVKPAAALGPQG
jgi:hypothetical protein